MPSNVTNQTANRSQIDTSKSTSKTTPSKEYLFKILVIGELATGKTSFIKRYVHQYFSKHYKATIGVDFALKIINWDPQTIVRLQLWDIAGQERFGNMTRVYYKEAVGALIAFDVSRPETLQQCLNWKKDLDQKVSLPDGSNVPCVLLANKCDLEYKGDCVEADFLNKFCKDNSIHAWFYTSPLNNVNIEESANCLIKKIIENQKDLDVYEADDDILNINFDHLQSNTPVKKCTC